MGRQEHVEIGAVLKHTTNQAYLLDTGDQEIWVPKSLCEPLTDSANKPPEVFSIAYWFALKNGMI